MLTNFTTIKKSIATLKRIEKMEKDGTFESLTKKEVSLLTKQKNKLEKNLGGIKDMKALPGAIFVIDTKKEAIAVTEAKKLGIPVIAVVDTNCDPTDITYPIPGNDDAIRAISLFVEIIARAVIDADNEAGNLQIVETLADEVVEEVAEEKESVVFSSEDENDLSKFEEKKEEPKDKTEVKTQNDGATVVAGIEVDDKTLYQD
jgi:small subunit ribosomal protein S2